MKAEFCSIPAEMSEIKLSDYLYIPNVFDHQMEEYLLSD